MPSPNIGLVTNDFRMGYRLQRTWSWSMATAFFCGEVGAGLFFVSLFTGLRLGFLIGLLMVAVGKASGHLLHLGRPAHAWRAIRKVRNSWISRGLLAIVVFTGSGLAVVFNAYQPGVLPAPLAAAAEAVAGTAALVIMVYQGLAMSHSSSISLWSNGLMPVTSFTYAVLGGVSVEMVLGWGVLSPVRMESLQAFALGLVLFGFVVVASFLHAAKYGPDGGRTSAALLLTGDLKSMFVLLVIIVGFAITGLLLVFGPGSYLYIVSAAITELAGYYTFRILMFKAATYDPVLSVARHTKR